VGDGGLRPHHFCKPLPKRPSDREALRKAVFAGEPKFFFGSDSAPHLKENKECPCGAAGVYSAPVALPLLVREFEQAGCLNKLPDFATKFGADFYQIPYSTHTLELQKNPWRVPESVDGVVPLAAGETLEWRVVL
jgi:dihydroorotase